MLVQRRATAKLIITARDHRSEQHGDQLLHELLRCFKALTMTAVQSLDFRLPSRVADNLSLSLQSGKRALISRSPTPFLPIASLLFSEKRPGDLPCRQLLVELLQSLFDICPESAEPIPQSLWTEKSVINLSDPEMEGIGGGSGGARRYKRQMKGGDDEDDEVEQLEKFEWERVMKTYRLVYSLVLGPPNEKEEAKVDFIQETHRPRIFKRWVSELSDTCRDYFW